MKNLRGYSEFLAWDTTLDRVVNEDIKITPEEMDKLHSEGKIIKNGVTITYKEPKNPVPQDESTK